ncbi:hypothetical protein [Bradyrhizobium sp. USDA 10063]
MSMIRKSGDRFSEKIMLKQELKRDDDSKKSHHARVQQSVLDDLGGGVGEIAEQCKGADAPDVSEELDLRQRHRGDAGRRIPAGTEH